MHTAHLIQGGQAGRGKRWAAINVIQRTVKFDYKGEGPPFLWKPSLNGQLLQQCQAGQLDAGGASAEKQHCCRARACRQDS